MQQKLQSVQQVIITRVENRFAYYKSWRSYLRNFNDHHEENEGKNY